MSRVLWPLAALLLMAGVAVGWWWGGSAGPAPTPPEHIRQAARARPPAPAPAPAPKTAPPVFEEPLPATPNLSRQELVNDALFRALSESGADPAHAKLSVRHDSSAEVARIESRLGPEQDLARVRRAIDKRLAALDVKPLWRQGSRGLELEVRLDGKVSNKLSLLLPSKGRTPVKPRPTPAHPAPAPPPPPPGQRPRVALVMDDMGYNMGAAKRLARLGLPLTLSVLPHAVHGKDVARLAQDNGLGLMLHLPMEPQAYPNLDPGPGALMRGMGDQELTRLTAEDLASVPGAQGVNNHMGSAFTADARSMAPVMEYIGSKGLFFLDSVTSGGTKAGQAARQAGVIFLRRTFFLDHDPGEAAVAAQLERILALSPSAGDVVVIGHPHESTLRVLERYAGRLKRDLDLVLASDMARGRALASRTSR